MQRDELKMIGDPLSRIKVSDELDELKDLMETWKEDQNALLLFVWIIFESILSLDDVTNENGCDSHYSFLD